MTALYERAKSGLFVPTTRFLKVFVTLGLLSGASAAANAQDVACTCRYQGEDYGIGESICLKGSNGMRMATCAMVLNNTSWKFSNAPCPLSFLESVQPPLDDELPVRQQPAVPEPPMALTRPS